MQGQEDAGFFKRLADGRHVVSKAARFEAHQFARLGVCAMNSDVLVVSGIVLMIHGATGENPHAARKDRIGVALHHKDLQIRSIIDQHDGCSRADRYTMRVEIRHLGRVALKRLMYAGCHPSSNPYSGFAAGIGFCMPWCAKWAHPSRGVERMRLKGSFLAAGLLAASLAHADRIELSDGGMLNGKVISMSNGSYRIQTDAMGVVTIPQNKIRSISSDAAPSAQALKQQPMEQAGSAAIQSMQSTMVNDPGIMSSIKMLQKDPDMQAVLQDPEVMRAVQNFDLQALQNNPKIRKLMNNRQVKNITNSVN